jgi:hypothetical protein
MLIHAAKTPSVLAALVLAATILLSLLLIDGVVERAEASSRPP